MSGKTAGKPQGRDRKNIIRNPKPTAKTGDMPRGDSISDAEAARQAAIDADLTADNMAQAGIEPVEPDTDAPQDPFLDALDAGVYDDDADLASPDDDPWLQQQAGIESVEPAEREQEQMAPAQAYIKANEPRKKPTAAQTDMAGMIQGTLSRAEAEAAAGGKDKYKALRWWGQCNYEYERDGDTQHKGISEADWRKLMYTRFTVFAKDYCDEFAFIFHDKDTEVIEINGKKVQCPKGLHVHFEWTCKHEKRTRHAVELALKRAGIPISSDYNLEWVQNWASTTQYLIHISAEAMADRKYIYNVRDVFVWLRNAKTPNQTDYAWQNEQGANDWMQENLHSQVGEQTRRAHGLQDGCDFYERVVACGMMSVDDVHNEIINDVRGMGIKPTQRSQVIAAANRGADIYRANLSKYYVTHRRQLSVVYVHGAGGTGKTDLAIALGMLDDAARTPDGCVPGGVHTPAAPGATTYDPYQTYDLQVVSVFDEDDISQQGGLVPWLSRTNPRIAPVVGSRNKDKQYFASRMYICNSETVEEYIGSGFDDYAMRKHVAGAVASKSERKDWIAHNYRQAGLADPKIGSKVYQAFRRIALDIELTPNNKGLLDVDVYVRDDKASNMREIYDTCDDYGALYKSMPDAQIALQHGTIVSVASPHDLGVQDDVHDVYLLCGAARYMVRVAASQSRDTLLPAADGELTISRIDVYAGWGLDAVRVAYWSGSYQLFLFKGETHHLEKFLQSEVASHSYRWQFHQTRTFDAPGPRFVHFHTVNDVDLDNVASISRLQLVLNNAEAHYYKLNGYPVFDHTRPVFCPVHQYPYMYADCQACKSSHSKQLPSARALRAMPTITREELKALRAKQESDAENGTDDFDKEQQDQQ